MKQNCSLPFNSFNSRTVFESLCQMFFFPHLNDGARGHRQVAVGVRVKLRLHSLFYTLFHLILCRSLWNWPSLFIFRGLLFSPAGQILWYMSLDDCLVMYQLSQNSWKQSFMNCIHIVSCSVIPVPPPFFFFKQKHFICSIWSRFF